mmetsp:Transcript_24447/g.42049  ORF Transcript_24447/g.42049 Transcript_24447/m.42049 type:complete len:132 (-) Transcript_24447:204-599(-)
MVCAYGGTSNQASGTMPKTCMTSNHPPANSARIQTIPPQCAVGSLAVHLQSSPNRHVTSSHTRLEESGVSVPRTDPKAQQAMSVLGALQQVALQTGSSLDKELRALTAATPSQFEQQRAAPRQTPCKGIRT